jgi:hypothetical protein
MRLRSPHSVTTDVHPTLPTRRCHVSEKNGIVGDCALGIVFARVRASALW